MTLAVVFPGQGSQHRGMGAELFAAYPEYVRTADEILGYSLRDLCLEDPGGKLQDTRFTQPALFVVNSLTYLSRLSQGGRKPDILAGHSLGEYSALFAADVIDFATGVRLVQRRGELMSQAPAGGMAAVVGLDPAEIRSVLERNRITSLDVANFNSPVQTVVAGSIEEIKNAADFFKEAGARYIVLNVGAAFHSRYMVETQISFRELVNKVDIRLPKIPVVANYTARPYASDIELIRETLSLQIANPVRWYEVVSYLLSLPDPQVEEVGPGKVLTNLTIQIKKKPLAIQPHREERPPEQLEPPLRASADRAASPGPAQEPRGHLATRPRLLFMYTGQGSQYYGMGEMLYQHSPVFRDAFDLCGSLAQAALDRPLAEIVYTGGRNGNSFDHLLHSNVANFALGFALTQTLYDRGIRPDALIGYGAGEFLAATVAGCISLRDGIEAVITQAKLLQEHRVTGGMLAVFDSPHVLDGIGQARGQFTVAGYNFPRHFLVSGDAAAVSRVESELSGKGIVCQPLPVKVGLHSPAMDAIEEDFRRFFGSFVFRPPLVPIYSPTELRWVSEIGVDYLWNACRKTVRFDRALDDLHASGVERFVDLGPSGTLAGFVRYHLNSTDKSLTAINRFGRNVSTLNALIERLEHDCQP